MDRELQWNDSIEHDGSDFVLLPPGDYNFTVLKFERKRFGGSTKLPACNQAALTIELAADDGTATTVTHNLFLHTKTEGLLCAFFRAIGARKHGERLVMDWSKVIGARGRCRVKVRDWTGKDGATKQSNEIDRFFDPPEDGADFPPADTASPGGSGFVPF